MPDSTKHPTPCPATIRLRIEYVAHAGIVGVLGTREKPLLDQHPGLEIPCALRVHPEDVPHKLPPMEFQSYPAPLLPPEKMPEDAGPEVLLLPPTAKVAPRD